MASRSSGRGGSNEPVSLSGFSERVGSHVLSCRSCMVGGWLVGLLGTKRLSRPMCATMAPELSGRSRVASHIACEMKAKVASKSLPDVRHRGYRHPDRNQHPSDDRVGNRAEITSQCAPPWPSISKPYRNSIPESSPNVRHRRHRYPNRFPMCATVAIETQTETRIDPTIMLEMEPKSLANVRHRGHRFPNRSQNRTRKHHAQNVSAKSFRT